MTDILMIDETRSLSNQGRVEGEKTKHPGCRNLLAKIKKDEAIVAVEFLISGSNDDRGAVCIGHKFN